MVTALRRFFRYLRHRGEVDIDLAGCVPCIRLVRSQQFRKFCPLAPSRKSCSGAFEALPPGSTRLRGPDAPCHAWTRHLEIVDLKLEDVDWERRLTVTQRKGGYLFRHTLATELTTWLGRRNRVLLLLVIQTLRCEGKGRMQRSVEL
jgi:hypothetical protein